MFYRVEKLQNRIHEIDRYRYRHKQYIPSFSIYEPDKGEEITLPEEYSNQVMERNDTWSGRDRYVWLHTRLQFPEIFKDEQVVLFVDAGRTGGGNNSGFEALLYVNRNPFQGVDSNHKEVILPSPLPEEIDIDLMLWSGLEGGGHPQEQYYRLKEAWFGVLDQRVDQFYYLSTAVLDAIKNQPENEAGRSMLLNLLNKAFQSIDWSDPGSDAFYESIYEAYSLLEDDLTAVEKQSDITIHTIGHSHIDLAWLWRVKHTKEKAKRTFSTVLRLAELYPDYIYLQSQPQLYQWMKEQEPELYQRIKERIKDGQWEIEGAMWVEADCNIPSGESLVRQLLYGKKFIKDEFQKDSRILWLPDVFGYSWALPQILKKSGVDTFMTTKISWNQYNRMPHDTFHWKGIDGTEILTHFVTTPEPGRPEDAWFYTYNGLITGETVKGIWEKYQDKAINRDLLLAYGYGDGGGGVNRDMLELKRQFDRIPGIPAVQSSTITDYFNKLHENVKETDEYVHTWDGELYLEYHRGTYTSQANMKRQNRRLEQAYRAVELLAVRDGINKGWSEYPAASIENGWKKILLNQFHDIIPGSSITEVYADADKEYAEAWGIVEEIKEQHKHLAQKEKNDSWSVFHPLQYKKDILLTIPDHSAASYQMNGKSLLTQETASGDRLVLVEEVKPFAYHTIEPGEGVQKDKTPLSHVNLEERTLKNDRYEMEWNRFGQLTRVFDKLEQREMLSSESPGNVFRIFEDKPMAHDAWDIDLFYQEKSKVIDTFKSCELIENGPLRTTLRFTWEWPGADIVQLMHCYKHTARIDFETKVDWTARQQLLKVEFPLAIRTTDAIFDIQFGNVKRPTHWNTSWDAARFESVGHKWAALSEPYYGISLMNDCKYGYSAKDNVLSLTLLKGAIHPDPYADIGVHHFTYSIFPFGGEGNKREVEKEAAYLDTEWFVTEGEIEAAYHHPFLTVSSDQVVIDAVKKAELSDKVIVRMHEMEGASGRVHLEAGCPVKGWREVNLMEEDLLREVKEEPIQLSFSPYELKSVELTINEQNRDI
ncbi:alpha-mannosidase [Thalassobacillus devorans]|uniref:Alpha-mannosidase n=1 Tax=Thalassobacillus devorans TaxID=279813 RepID=A0ABQ1NXS0_9BACI|nr:alpha-mannosidase [Thalassobacillus devorans]NIK28581.1 alpha-mannosidase [Thalassobacillus devorans]GGC85108.1 alpha-mannosidase [Thalassobacillus devorans]